MGPTNNAAKPLAGDGAHMPSRAAGRCFTILLVGLLLHGAWSPAHAETGAARAEEAAFASTVSPGRSGWEPRKVGSVLFLAGAALLAFRRSVGCRQTKLRAKSVSPASRPATLTQAPSTEPSSANGDHACDQPAGQACAHSSENGERCPHALQV